MLQCFFEFVFSQKIVLKKGYLILTLMFTNLLVILYIHVFLFQKEIKAIIIFLRPNQDLDPVMLYIKSDPDPVWRCNTAAFDRNVCFN